LARYWLVFAAAAWIAGPAWAQPSTPALERLKSDLLSNPSATQVLTRWCGDLRLASPPVIRAERDAVAKAPTPEIVALLAAGPDEAIRYRHVRLVCGTHLLSEADNWYRPSQLTGEMNKALDNTDVPFGTVVRPLNFHRKALGTAMAADRPSPLQVRALLLTEAEVPFSLVVENYSRDLVAGSLP
jgi:chorismate-pyruvate lyase